MLLTVTHKQKQDVGATFFHPERFYLYSGLYTRTVQRQMCMRRLLSLSCLISAGTVTVMTCLLSRWLHELGICLSGCQEVLESQLILLLMHRRLDNLMHVIQL